MFSCGMIISCHVSYFLCAEAGRHRSPPLLNLKPLKRIIAKGFTPTAFRLTQLDVPAVGLLTANFIF
jgi:hypothetical protein